MLEDEDGVTDGESVGLWCIPLYYYLIYLPLNRTEGPPERLCYTCAPVPMYAGSLPTTSREALLSRGKGETCAIGPASHRTGRRAQVERREVLVVAISAFAPLRRLGPAWQVQH